MPSIPVIDIFAGPGGLSEGFSRYSSFTGDDVRFLVSLSVEKDRIAHQTLTLRAFVRQFEEGELPEEYYEFLRCDDATQAEGVKEVLKSKYAQEWKVARQETMHHELGTDGFEDLRARLVGALDGRRDWVLLGGPPCQAYSVIGRSRITGIGRAGYEDDQRQIPSEAAEGLREEARRKFLSDHRHTLYREYLRIVALYSPAVFVMENVTGILNSRMPAGLDSGDEGRGRIFDRILGDLRDPRAALEEDSHLDPGAGEQPGNGDKYRLYSFSERGDLLGLRNHDFKICCEDYGVPQARHRVIIVGIRDDVDAAPAPLERGTEKSSVYQIIDGMPALRSGRSRGQDSAESWAEVVRQQVSDEFLEVIDDPEIREAMLNARDSLDKNLGRGGRFVSAIYRAPATNTDLDRWIEDPRVDGYCQHESRQHMDGDFLRYLFVAAYGKVHGRSPKLRHFPATLMPDHRSATGQHIAGAKTRTFHDRFRVQVADDPATTVMAHIRKDGHYYIHYDPTQCRSLTVREAARLQTFPDNYFFMGNRTEQYQQVGNAVPPYLAVQLAGVVADVLRESSMAARRSDRDAA